MKYQIIVFLSLLMGFQTTTAQEKTDAFNQQEELGWVSWHRDYDEALKIAQQEDKPVFLFFQEVPGCATCRNYGNKILTNPLMVEAIENEFVPLVIFNNKGGKDKEVLEIYKEPTWNNPVVRIVDSSGKNIVNRLSGDYSSAGLFQTMRKALALSKKQEPKYFELLGQELQASNSSDVEYYQMYCFWSGESHLGDQEGVVATEPGWMSGREVVKVTFDESVVSNKALTKHAAKANCKPIDYTNDYRIDKDPQYYLKNSKFSGLPLSDIQKTKINAAIKSGENAEEYLSPFQYKLLKAQERKEIAVSQDYDNDFAETYHVLKSGE